MAEKNIHGGHRTRVKEKFLRDGIDGFEKHEMLELLLFYAIPQKDTNPLAHELINRFGSLKGVFEASYEELCSVNGISTHAATLLKLVPAIWGEAAGEADRRERYGSVSKIGKLMVSRYAGITVETVFLVLLDNSWHIIDIIKLCEGSVDQVYADIRKIIEYTIKKNASMALLTHNHPNGSLIPSPEDITTTIEISKAFKAIRVDFLEHLLISGDRFEPILSKTETVFWNKADKTEFYK